MLASRNRRPAAHFWLISSSWLWAHSWIVLLRPSASGVRREKAMLFPWVQVPPGEVFPGGSYRSSGGGNEAAEAFGNMHATKYGGSTSVQAVT